MDLKYQISVLAKVPKQPGYTVYDMSTVYDSRTQPCKKVFSTEGVWRADLTGHGHLAHVNTKGLNDYDLLGQPFKAFCCYIVLNTVI